MPRNGVSPPDPHANALRDEVAEGLRYAHARANSNTAKTLEASSFLYALVELLSERGLIAIDELDQRKRDVMERLQVKFGMDGMGVVLQDPQPDKYAFAGSPPIDCETRIPLCKASCCRLPFALSKQDLEERVVRWDFSVPYMIKRGEDGYCTHLDRCTQACAIYQNRPVPCRGYDCRKDKRIWLDFANRIPNPAVDEPDWLARVREAKPEA